MPTDVTNGIVIKCVNHMDEVISLALLGETDATFTLNTIPKETPVILPEDKVTAH